MAARPALLEAWQGPVIESAPPLVLPDGCRDLIALIPATGPPRWHVSVLFDRALVVPAAPGARFIGWRLHPAAVIDVDGLLGRVHGLDGPDDDDVLALLAEHVQIDRRVADALTGLADARSVASAARAIGVSPRTLERQTVAGTGRTPAYWKNLARARRAAGDLAASPSLAEAALAHGFADQAHMTREFRTWFAVSPARFRSRPELVVQVRAPGYR